MCDSVYHEQSHLDILLLIKHSVLCMSRVVVSPGSVITRETLNRALHLTLTPTIQSMRPWGVCPPALAATPPQLTEVGRNSEEDIAISVSHMS